MFLEKQTISEEFLYTASSKNAIREKINNEMKKYLDNGGIINEIPNGYTNQKYSFNSESFSKKNRLAPTHISNEKIKEYEAKQEEKKNVAIIVEEKIEDSKCKIKKNKPVKAPKVKAIKPPKKRTRKYKLRDEEESKRRNYITEQRILALSESRTEFTAVCKEHGETTYTIRRNVARCSKCVNEYRSAVAISNSKCSEQEFQEKRQRKAFNQKALEQALSQDVNCIQFMGLCLHCGPTLMRVGKQPSKKTDTIYFRYYCETCQKKSIKKNPVNNSNEHRLRQEANREALKKALDLGELSFIGTCMRCGPNVSMRVRNKTKNRKNPTYSCIGCNNNYGKSHKREL